MATPAGIADELRTEILELRFAQGEALREIALAEKFGTSRRSVREALLALAQEGMVSHERNRGAHVRHFTPEDVIDLYAARSVLEAEGARHCDRASDDLIDAVQLALVRLRRAAGETQDSPLHASADVAFHASIIGLSGSPRLNDFFARLRGEMTYGIRLLQHREVTAGLASRDVLSDHERIAAAVFSRDAEAAERAVLDHIRVSEEQLQAITAGAG
ncbi:MAG TPA: GntR family transcriptional regulator [Marmoricola sp.]|nr:GntR family transcriptional regulator [Marmoricola sp.]